MRVHVPCSLRDPAPDWRPSGPAAERDWPKKVPPPEPLSALRRWPPMRLARFYLPLRDNAGEPFAAAMFRTVEAELSARFGGVTAHLQSPASGLWHDGGSLHADEVVIFEVLSEDEDRQWWRAYRDRLARDFRQKSILMLLQEVEVV